MSVCYVSIIFVCSPKLCRAVVGFSRMASETHLRTGTWMSSIGQVEVNHRLMVRCNYVQNARRISKAQVQSVIRFRSFLSAILDHD